MVERTRGEQEVTHRNTNTTLAGLALLMSLVAMGLALASNNRTGKQLDTMVDDKVNAAVQDLGDDSDFESFVDMAGWTTAKTGAAIQLVVIRSEITADTVSDQTDQQIAGMRNSLDQAYTKVGSRVATEYQQIDLALDRVEQNLRTNDETAINAIEDALTALGISNRRTDEDS